MKVKKNNSDFYGNKMKYKDKFLEQAEDIIQECEKQIKDLEEIVKIKKEINTEKTNK